MNLYDALLVLDGRGRILSVRWEEESLRRACADAWEACVGLTPEALFTPPPTAASGTFTWLDEEFFYACLHTDFDRSYLLVRRGGGLEYLYQQALEHLDEGVQIYDRDACAVYFNKSSRRLSEIPEHVPIEGRHLLDLYELNEDRSTTLTCLRTRAPIINRVDCFRACDGNAITTSNTAYPILYGRELAGAVVFERSAAVTQAQLTRLERVRDGIADYASGEQGVKFTGYSFESVVGSGEKLAEAVRLAKRVAEQDCSVLLVGETGTGKEVFAQSIHRASGRRGKKFLAINCAAVPEALIEGLLFGTRRGAFTGSADRAGYFEEANGGTLFLDELNSMSLSMQSKLLRVVQEGTFRRVGGDRDLTSDVRLISSCNEDPFRLISENTLRRDLFYRLSTVVIELPALREHIGDISILADYYIRRTAHQYGKPVDGLSREALALLERCEWPGNVRELFHVLDHAMNVTDGGLLEVCHLPRRLVEEGVSGPDAPVAAAPAAPLTAVDRGGLQAALDEYECSVLRAVLEQLGGNVTQAARRLNLSRQSLQYRLRKYGIVV